LEWISSTAFKILGWMTAIAARPEAILLTGIMLFLALSLAIGLAFALDADEPRPVRTSGWLLLGCSLAGIGCGSMSLLAA